MRRPRVVSQALMLGNGSGASELGISDQFRHAERRRTSVDAQQMKSVGVGRLDGQNLAIRCSRTGTGAPLGPAADEPFRAGIELIGSMMTSPRLLASPSRIASRNADRGRWDWQDIPSRLSRPFPISTRPVPTSKLESAGLSGAHH